MLPDDISGESALTELTEALLIYTTHTDSASTNNDSGLTTSPLASSPRGPFSNSDCIEQTDQIWVAAKSHVCVNFLTVRMWHKHWQMLDLIQKESKQLYTM